jgi:hypothetical protein
MMKGILRQVASFRFQELPIPAIEHRLLNAMLAAGLGYLHQIWNICVNF